MKHTLAKFAFWFGVGMLVLSSFSLSITRQPVPFVLFVGLMIPYILIQFAGGGAAGRETES